MKVTRQPEVSLPGGFCLRMAALRRHRMGELSG